MTPKAETARFKTRRIHKRGTPLLLVDGHPPIYPSPHAAGGVFTAPGNTQTCEAVLYAPQMSISIFLFLGRGIRIACYQRYETQTVGSGVAELYSFPLQISLCPEFPIRKLPHSSMEILQLIKNNNGRKGYLQGRKKNPIQKHQRDLAAQTLLKVLSSYMMKSRWLWKHLWSCASADLPP